MSINRRCTIKIEPCNTGYQANIGFEDFYTTEDKYCHTINRATMKELKLAINDLKKSFPNHYISINNISSFQEKSTPFIHVILGILGVFILIGIAFFSLSAFSEQAKIASNTSWDKIAALFNNVGAPIFALMSYLALLYTLHQQNRITYSFIRGAGTH
ncbi:hypothetical protein [Photobacterium leiognathi]|uniref:hypothetical protein n=1 Tax=Photobacterium leiognathi TaxID=553611 RepID=UPI0027375046|nr:hypothetical protein [Photobacterium leiognathi]